MVRAMPVPRAPSGRCAPTLRALLAAFAALVVLAGCAASMGGAGSSTGGSATLLRYERVWPDGRTEEQTLSRDGRLAMMHGEVRERLTLPPEDLARITEALAKDIPVGSPDDSPRRRLTLGDGTLIEAPRPDPGTVTELLERLLDTHGLS